MGQISLLLPAYRLSIKDIDRIIEELPDYIEPPLVILNDDDESIIEHLEGLRRIRSIGLLQIPFQVGKAEALRQGIEFLVQESNTNLIVQFDGRSKQSVKQLPLLLEALSSVGADMIVGDRYSRQDMEGQNHRKAGVMLIALIVEHLTGYNLPDVVCGFRVYTRDLALQFSKLRCFGYGAEMEQLLIASLSRANVSSIPLESNRQADATNAEKLEDNFYVLVNYANEIAMPKATRNSLNHILACIKRRMSFDIDLSVFDASGYVRLDYIGSSKDIVGAYTSQQARDAYTASASIHMTY